MTGLYLKGSRPRALVCPETTVDFLDKPQEAPLMNGSILVGKTAKTLVACGTAFQGVDLP